MTYQQFKGLAKTHPTGVVLLEGRRVISAREARQATALATHLAEQFPHLLFRSGNALGSDHAFSEGIAAVDPARLQIVAPYPSHRKNARYTHAVYDSPESLTPGLKAEIAAKTIAASPHNSGLIRSLDKSGPLAAKAAYLLRDTMKVTGHSPDFPKPICALFYIHPDDPEAGGTGHTIRVCRQQNVPHAFQNSWHHWK